MGHRLRVGPAGLGGLRGLGGLGCSVWRSARAGAGRAGLRTEPVGQAGLRTGDMASRCAGPHPARTLPLRKLPRPAAEFGTNES